MHQVYSLHFITVYSQRNEFIFVSLTLSDVIEVTHYNVKYLHARFLFVLYVNVNYASKLPTLNLYKQYSTYV